MPRQVLVLNATYEPINTCSTKRAVVLLLKNKAEILEGGAEVLRAARLTVTRPLVIRLRTYVKVPRGDRRRLSRRAVLARDGYRCQYCGSVRHLTLDHIVPRSRGGSTCWENVVTSCAPCNTRKGASLPDEIGMALARTPRPPTVTDFLSTSPHGVPPSWRPYLSAAVA
ncbi:MAG: HNH endonuclease [Thermoleophilia bacterium]|nr:HNH endonuclease [Thermoleophilia bacterium]